MQRKRRSVLAQSGDLSSDADDLLVPGGQISVKVAVVLLTIRAGHQHADVASEHVLRRIPEQPLSGGVERLNEAGGIDHDDGIHSAFDDGSEQFFSTFHMAWNLN